MGRFRRGAPPPPDEQSPAKLCQLQVTVTGETDKALFVWVEGGGEQTFPKSQVAFSLGEVRKKGDTGRLVVTRWIAERKSEDDGLDESLVQDYEGDSGGAGTEEFKFGGPGNGGDDDVPF